MERLIFHVDVNNAFLSWESMYRITKLHEDLDLRTVPSIVGGDRESRHGIVLAKSLPAKAYGIQTAQTIQSALNKCPHLIIVPPRFEIYHKCSEDFLKILSDFTPDLEKVSIDEAFLDMTETCHLFGNFHDAAKQLKNRIRDELFFTVNIGVSTNKLLAKMASDFQKPDLVHSLFPNEIERKMWPLPVSELYFVGRSAQKKMHLLGIHTIGDLAHFDPSLLISHFGDKYGTLIYKYANGIADDKICSDNKLNKGYGNSVTLSEDVTSYETARQVLLSLSETIGMRLRADQVKCNSITVELKDSDFNTQSHQMTLLVSTNITNVIFETSYTLLKEFWQPTTPLRLLGIRTSKISTSNFNQLTLFSNVDECNQKKQEQLEVCLDKIRNKYGSNSIQRASIINTKK
ncbi:MAG: DNA polymerase IV [Velocimicrobium sp.]